MTGPSPSAVREQLEIVKAVAAQHGGRDAVCVEGEEANKELWTIRKQCLWAAMSRSPILHYMFYLISF
jgi:FAD linked oxidases, C-terminal domain